MESRGNDERVKFVGPEIYVNDHITLNFLIYLLATFHTLMQPNWRACLVVGKFDKELEMERVRWKVWVMIRE